MSVWIGSTNAKTTSYNMVDDGFTNFKMTTTQFQAKRAGEHEAKVVGLLLSHYKLSHYKGKLIQQQRTATGQRRLTMLQFLWEFPSFPIYLFTAHIERVAKEATVSRMFMKFTQRRFVRHFNDMLDTVPEEQRHGSIGMVFHWPYIGNGGLILHTNPVAVDDSGCRMFWRKGRQQFCLEPFKQFLSNLEWELND